MVVLKRAGKQAGGLGVGGPVGDGQAADEAEQLGQVLALGPVVAQLGLEVVETDLGAVLIRALVDGKEAVTQQR